MVLCGGTSGKKLLFMGGEFAQSAEWNHQRSLDWHLLDDQLHQGVQRLVKDLNTLYVSTPALHQLDCKSEGFEWIEENGVDESVLAWLRRSKDGSEPILVVSNFTPVERSACRIGVPSAGRWVEVLNTDATQFGEVDVVTWGGVNTEAEAFMGRPFSVVLTLPPLSTLMFKHGGD